MLLLLWVERRFGVCEERLSAVRSSAINVYAMTFL